MTNDNDMKQRIQATLKRLAELFLFGVRGTGKRTWARPAFPAPCLAFDLLGERRHQEWLADPSLLSLETAHLRPGPLIMIDEFQRVPRSQ